MGDGVGDLLGVAEAGDREDCDHDAGDGCGGGGAGYCGVEAGDFDEAEFGEGEHACGCQLDGDDCVEAETEECFA